jgi:Domain of unknown function (DUF4259)
MGAWGTGPFENDDAADWVYEVEDGGLDAIHDVLDATVDIDAPGSEVGTAAVAAAELVAVIAGQPGPPLPDEVVALISDLGPVEPALVDAALAAVAHVRTEGELAELWAESDDHDAWLATLDDITRRLQAVR